LGIISLIFKVLTMAVKLRLQRKGRKKAPYYHIVAADSRSPRDGKYIERLGFYNPLTVPATIEINREAAFKWVMNGAIPTDTVNAILKFKGVNFQKHLAIGVKKGAFTQEEADAKMADWLTAKDAKIKARVEKTKQAVVDRHKAISGTAKVVAAPVVAPVEEVTEVVEVAETAAGTVEAVVAEEVVEIKDNAETVVEEAVATVEESVSTEAAPEAAEPTASEETTTEEA
jgi:small subunit ribosomal protein S16